MYVHERDRYIEVILKKGFTLAEIMIALVVIGVITSILLPVAFNNVPNENIMKFKKGNATLAKVINELVTSGEYNTQGDLARDNKGNLINSHTNIEYSKYFCVTFSDLLNVKNVKCENSTNATVGGGYYCWDWAEVEMEMNGVTVGQAIDRYCKNNISESLITTNDNIIYYEANQFASFGITFDGNTYDTDRELFHIGAENNTDFDDGKYSKTEYMAKFGLYRCFKVFCMDVDNLNKGEDPFGYGIRVDGKITLGARAQEWLQKSIQDKE